MPWRSNGAAAGEDLAIVTGRGDPRLVNLENSGPYIREDDGHVLGVRAEDDYLAELKTLGFSISEAPELLTAQPASIAERALETVTSATAGFRIHLDIDVGDAAEMAAVDCPEPKGPAFRIVAETLEYLPPVSAWS